ncbi:MAG: cytochrome c [Bacteroidia bacterium]|nr:cytochrome c [Bacteroidia bacterium]
MKFLFFLFIISVISIACKYSGSADETNIKNIYTQQCVTCHGEQGNTENTKVKKLSISTLDDNFTRIIIKNGKGSMPAFKNILTDNEIEGLIIYTKIFRK